MSDRPVVFWQMPPCWGLPNASPFCMKLETWLRMAKIPYEARQLAGPPRSASGKVPYVERPDGSFLADSSVIIETLSREHGVDLDVGLTAGERAISLLLQRLFEEELYFFGVYDRWVPDDAWAQTRTAYFGGAPWPVRAFALPFIRRSVCAAARGQGVARLSPEARAKKVEADVAAIAQMLGDREHFHGRPSTIDAIAYAFLANTAWAPTEGAARDAVRAHDDLMAYLDRMRERWFPEYAPPAPPQRVAPDTNDAATSTISRQTSGGAK